MKFKYFKFPLSRGSDFFGFSILRPIIPVTAKVGNIEVSYAALIDSGADFCIFHGEIGELLGLNVRQGKSERFGGIQTGLSAEAFLHEITLSIGGWNYKAVIGFSYDIAPQGYGILGQKGFFGLFIVKFDLTKEEIELKERRT